MPTRNVVLTDHHERLIADLVESGRYQNASEVLRDGLRLIEERDSREAAKLRALQEAAFTAYGELAGAGDMLMRHCDIPEIATLVKLWRKVSLLADKAAGKENIVRLQGDPWSHFCPDSP